ncbi:Flp pilus assembly protein TadG [Aggregatibacter actinomycetemcomitans]|uniref:pilus assembly protein TadG-related protein n=1 Tax=Aggregatibacter actinomycetemcomitans TaxID=714 RepID=UPI0001B9F3CB|nr:pilus assembly protein TadG-related protein [Aggregatibacter actinomycetemcomitans]ACX82150.1 pilus assembly protein TadG [Aggregatibacter actinomycetemcomitans D11S-1]KOE59575.1 pilus assembly protein TadG [Aggregatibacter actinomycetemcomitans serotype c str. SCC2302]KOE61340.1 pilus assembly protein TadG [Aggregatibacter actinomycetemcomitans serotype c str. AAS4A]KYK76254.1 TadG [Aggregatibacter actinomycetemcomitans serotype e str. SA2149]KYK79096.1 TadG [Aggregatibacter actinomycetemc
MKRNFNLTAKLFSTVKQFLQNEHGVYTIITALLAFPLLLFVAFTVDGTGILLDKARLAQATDQAALLLIAEDNQYRKNKDHSDVKRQNVSQQEIEREGRDFSSAKVQAQWKKRNQELVQGLVKLYLRSDDSKGQKNSSPVTIKEPFLAECLEEKTQPKNKNGTAKSIACVVQGSVQRKFWLPWGQTLVSSSQLYDGRVGINSGKTYAVKEKQITIPIDLMMVTDLSRSMMWAINATGNNPPEVNYPNRRIDALREAVEGIEKILLPAQNKGDVSPYNRMGFVSFAAGTRQRDELTNCVLPYYVKSEDKKREISAKFKKGYNGGNHIAKGFELLDRDLDIPKTIDQISQFDGQKRTYDFTLDSKTSRNYCLEDNVNKKTTQAWFDKNNRAVASALKQIIPRGGTAVTSGIFIGTNLMMEKNKDFEAMPNKIGTNTRRILMILSDGEDNIPSKDTLVKLMEAGLCTRVKEKIDGLQDSNYPKVETRIAFVAFGFNPPQKQQEVWKKCVGDQYYSVSSKQALFDAFKQIISFEEEVGRSSSQKPKLFQ